MLTLNNTFSRKKSIEQSIFIIHKTPYFSLKPIETKISKERPCSAAIWKNQKGVNISRWAEFLWPGRKIAPQMKDLYLCLGILTLTRILSSYWSESDATSAIVIYNGKKLIWYFDKTLLLDGSKHRWCKAMASKVLRQITSSIFID